MTVTLAARMPRTLFVPSEVMDTIAAQAELAKPRGAVKKAGEKMKGRRGASERRPSRPEDQPLFS